MPVLATARQASANGQSYCRQMATSPTVIPEESPKGRGLYWVRIRDGLRAGKRESSMLAPPTWVFPSLGSAGSAT
jgi:hypothetical protein